MEQHLTLHVHQLTTMDRHRGEQNRSIENAQAVPATRPSTLRRYCACAERATLPALRLRHGCGARRQWTAARALSRRRRPLVSGKGAAAPGGPLARHRQLRVAVRPVAVDDADLNAGRGSSSPPANGAYPWHGLARTESRCRDQGQAGAPGGEHKALENLPRGRGDRRVCRRQCVADRGDPQGGREGRRRRSVRERRGRHTLLGRTRAREKPEAEQGLQGALSRRPRSAPQGLGAKASSTT